LSVIVGIYLLLSLNNSDAAIEALAASWKIIVKLLPILTAVIVLLGILNYFLDPKKLAKHLRKESGFRGWMIAVAGGILSHGPSYIWFPILSDLRNHGTKEGLIATFMYVRAIKLPWIPVMIDYFGWPFTLILAFFIIVAGVVQGLLIDFFDRQESAGPI
jgi:uncharacterized membrane protein YraQ (UPF0718 family)